MDPAAIAPEVLWAHPVAVLAIPAFVPVVAIVATVLWVARKDRLAEAREQPDPAPAEHVEPPRPWRTRLPRLVVGDED